MCLIRTLRGPESRTPAVVGHFTFGSPFGLELHDYGKIIVIDLISLDTVILVTKIKNLH